MTDTFPVQHDRSLLEATATDLTGLPAIAGDTHLAWMATLTPVVSGPIRFSMHGDGFVEDAYADCPACGRGVSESEVRGVLTIAESVQNLLVLATGPRSGFLARLGRRMSGICGTCDRDTRNHLINEKYESRPADFIDPADIHDDDEEDLAGDQDDWVYGGWK